MALFFTIPAAIIPSLVLLALFHRLDRFPEPPRVIWATFGLGASTIILLSLGDWTYVEKLVAITDPYLRGTAVAFLAAAIPEESLKLCVLLLYCARHTAFDEPMDGLVYGVAASLGFATFENIFYVVEGGLGVAIVRALTAVPCHAFMGAIMGYYVGMGTFSPSRKRTYLLLAWAVPVLLHGLYDAPLLASTAIDEIGIAASGGVHLALFAGTVAVLFVELTWAVRLARKLRALQNSEIYDQAQPLSQ